MCTGYYGEQQGWQGKSARVGRDHESDEGPLRWDLKTNLFSSAVDLATWTVWIMSKEHLSLEARQGDDPIGTAKICL